MRHFRHYIYGQRCEVFTDHETLKALLNTPHPSGKLAQWGLTLQELDLHIYYRPGNKNNNADALSRCPIGSKTDIEEEVHQVATLQPEVAPAESGDPDLVARQRGDPTLSPIMGYLKDGTLPDEEKVARRLLLEQSQFALIGGVLYRVLPDGALRVVPPTPDRYALFQEAHAGKFGGHLREQKVYSQLC